ncbi:MAG: tRNA (guanosine(46)-N7)-methyltransferase TrmB [Bacteroidetes bacterium]|nr:tRNA (guanosine(46)-N7)-methyltransferase TrmB [Bacteroidota bacterium]
MPKKKLIHFRENLGFPHLFQVRYHELSADHYLRSSWNAGYFHNENPIVLELGCGKGEYTIGLALKSPHLNFIGMDLKGARLWRGCKTVEEKGLKNVAFIRAQIDHLERFFGQEEVSEIWITFPDPQPAKERRRLTAPVFLERYRKILIPGGIIHLKTDNREFYDYTLNLIIREKHQLLFQSEDLYSHETEEEATMIQTYYENIWLEAGKKICYLRFRLNSSSLSRCGNFRKEINP